MIPESLEKLGLFYAAAHRVSAFYLLTVFFYGKINIAVFEFGRLDILFGNKRACCSPIDGDVRVVPSYRAVIFGIIPLVNLVKRLAYLRKRDICVTKSACGFLRIIRS